MRRSLHAQELAVGQAERKLMDAMARKAEEHAEADRVRLSKQLEAAEAAVEAGRGELQSLADGRGRLKEEVTIAVA